MPLPHSTLRLTAQQQAANLREIQKAIYHEPDLASEWLGAGLWVAYAVLAVVWFRLARRQSIRWLGTIAERVVLPVLARRRVRPRVSVAWRPRAPLAPEPAIGSIWSPAELPVPHSPAAVPG